jgi:hypothetical protein
MAVSAPSHNLDQETLGVKCLRWLKSPHGREALLSTLFVCPSAMLDQGGCSVFHEMQFHALIPT